MRVTEGRERSREEQYALPQFLRHLVEQVLLHQVHQLQSVAQRLVRIEDPPRVRLHCLLLFLHHCWEDQPGGTQTHGADETLFALCDDGEGAVGGYAGVVVMYGECKFVEADAAVAGLLAAEGDEFLIPGVKYAVDLDVEHLPPQLPRVVATVAAVLLPLQRITPQFLAEAKLTTQLHQFLHSGHCYRSSCLHTCPELLDGLVADVLPDDELVLADLLIRVLVVLLGEVDTHAAQQFGGQGADLLVELAVEGIGRREVLFQQGKEVEPFLIGDCRGFHQLALLQQSLSEQRLQQQLPHCLPQDHCGQPIGQLCHLGRAGGGRGLLDLVDLPAHLLPHLPPVLGHLPADVLRHHQLVLLRLLLTEQLLADHHVTAQVSDLARQFQIWLCPPQPPHLVLVEVQVAALCI